MRTTKSARPGSVVYVPMDKSEFRSIIFSEKKKNKIKKIVILIILMIFVIGCCMYAGISYYYSYHFFYGTTINGIDSSNKTAYEVEQEIAGKKDSPSSDNQFYKRIKLQSYDVLEMRSFI